jgi:hypothetical protein
MKIEDLIGKGYFAEELPPSFQTKEIASVAKDLLLYIERNKESIGKKHSKIIPFSIPKIKGYRRLLGIPNPLHYLQLAATISQNWEQIVLHCLQSPYSLSALTIKAETKRAVARPGFNAINEQRIIRSTGFRYLLKIDITRFYPSLYTHSIPWALHSKSEAKKERRRKLFGNALDEDCRNIQDAQTSGIPIGPDSSRIISEIILSAVDKQLRKVMPEVAGMRIIDDYYIYCKTLGQTEKARSEIQKSLKQFELELNHTKEHIIDLPEVIENISLTDLREYRFRNSINNQRKDLITYFDKAVGYARQFPYDSILSYAVSKLKATIIYKENWNILQSLLLNSLNIESKVLPAVAECLIAYDQQEYDLDKNLIGTALEDFIHLHVSMNNDFEITWALWIFNALKISITKDCSDLVSRYDNAIVLISWLQLRAEGLAEKGSDIRFIRRLLTKESLYSEHWLLAYEALQKGWLLSSENYIQQDVFFKYLSDNNISFFNADEPLDLSKMKIATEDSSLEREDDADEDEDFRSLRNRPYEPDHFFENLDPEDLPF